MLAAVGIGHERRPPAAGVVTAGRLDLDDPRAKVAEHHRRVRTGQGTGQVDHHDVVQSSHDAHRSGRRRVFGPRPIRSRLAAVARYSQEMADDWNTQIINEFRANSGRVGGNFEGAPMALLTTTGAKSGQLRTSPDDVPGR